MSFPHVQDGVHLLPVLHDRLEYADLVRERFRQLQPDAVVVEIPTGISKTWLRGVERLPAISVLLYEDASDRTTYLPIQPADPFVEVARLADDAGIPLVCGDLDVDGYADYRDAVPDAYALLRVGPDPIYTAFRQQTRVRDRWDEPRESALAASARKLRDEGAQRVLLLCGMHHAEGVVDRLRQETVTPLIRAARRNLRLVHVHPESLGEVLREIPFHVAVYEARRDGLPAAPSVVETASETHHGPFRVLSGGAGALSDPAHAVAQAAIASAAPGEERPGPVDRLLSQRALLAEAERALVAAAPDETVQRWQRANLARFGRNLALSSGMLLPDLFDLLTAARGCVSDAYAWEVHRLATSYPSQATTATDFLTARIRADELYDGVRRIRISRGLRKPKRPDWRALRRRRTELRPGEWLEGFDSNAICSYPPEDLVIEEFGRYLKRRGKRILCDERSRSVPFSTSVLDGIDVRETVRHWAERTIYVREAGRAPGSIGSVMIVFDEDEATFPYCQTWLGEHEQESDMAFYSTEPADAVVGPGICRVSYGGMLLSYPPGRMADVWEDPDYRVAESRAEVLLLAAIDYSVERVVVHVAPRPPRQLLCQLADRLGLKILHVPLGTLSTATLKRLRVMHILAGHDKRKIAKDYIW